MLKRISSIFMVLCFVVIGLFAITPATSAKATTSPIPIQHAFITMLNAYESGGVQVSACRGDLSTDSSSIFLDSSGNIRNTLQGPAASNGGYCDYRASYGAEDGTLYGTRQAADYTSSTLFAWKNNRQLWQVSSTSPTTCANGWTSKNMLPTSISEGPDGNLYMILVGQVTPRSCDDRLLSVTPGTGHINFDVSIGNSGSIDPKAWTYSDAIVVLDRTGAVREFGYNGVENTSVSYAFPLNGRRIESSVSNNDGTVFGMAGNVLFYHKRNGTSGSITDNYAWPSINQIQPTSDGNVMGVGYNGPARLDYFDLATNAVSPSYPTPGTSGYSTANIVSYVEDENGNQLTAWSLSNSSGDHASSIDLYDSATSATSTIFLREYKSSDPSNYPQFSDYTGGFLRDGIGGGSVYLGLCEHSNSECFGTPAPDFSIYKVSSGSFDKAIGKGYKRNGYTTTKKKYVAMGDSYSSGEGNSPFLYGSDVSGGDQCHRSADAYPIRLENNLSLDLDMTNFVACSGAVMNNITSAGQYGEPAQVNALSSSTDVVTISIGGNDAKFGDALKTCIYKNDPPSTWTEGQTAYDRYSCGKGLEDSESIINGDSLIDGATFTEKFDATLSSILGHIGMNTQVYVLGYPNLFPAYDEIPSAGLCIWGASAIGYENTSSRAVNEEEVGLIRRVGSELNTTMSTALDDLGDSRLHFVDVTSAFANHEVCSAQPYLYQLNLSYPDKGSYHPNHDGEEAYANIITDAIG